MTTAFQEFENAWKQWRDLTISSWSGMAQQMVESDAVAQSMAASYDWGLEMQRRTRDNMQTFLQTIDVPTGEDLARVSRQIVSAEGRVLDCEDQLDALRTRLDVADSAAQKARSEVAELRARVTAAESAAREAQAEVAELRARLPSAERPPERGPQTQPTRRRKNP